MTERPYGKTRRKAEKEAEAARKQAARAAPEELAAKQKADSAASAAALKENVAEMVVPIVVQSQAPKAQGMHTVVTYSGNLIDKNAAIRFCLENNKLHLIDLNMSIINKMVTAEKEHFSMPGIEVVKKEDLRCRP